MNERVDPATVTHADSLTRGFVPQADERAFRDALGRFASGVTIVTARGAQGGPVGMTANSFASVSLDPPLVLWSVDRASHRFPVFAEAPAFAIHVLAEHQRDTALAFARDARAFDGHPWWPNAQGVPVLDDTLARFECRTHAVHDGGDHAIVVGYVERAKLADGAPLVWSDGDFGRFTAFG